MTPPIQSPTSQMILLVGVDWIEDKICKSEKEVERDKSGGHVSAIPSLEVALELGSLSTGLTKKNIKETLFYYII